MADSKISALTDGSPLQSGDQIAIARSGSSLRVNGFAGFPGYEIGYDQITSNVSVTSLTESTGTTVISCAAHSFDGAAVICEFFSPQVDPPNASNGFIVVSLFESTTQIGELYVAVVDLSGTAGNEHSAIGKLRFTPSAASHTYTVTAYVSATTGTPRIRAGAGGTGALVPAFVRFTKV